MVVLLTNKKCKTDVDPGHTPTIDLGLQSVTPDHRSTPLGFFQFARPLFEKY